MLLFLGSDVHKTEVRNFSLQPQIWKLLLKMSTQYDFETSTPTHDVHSSHLKISMRLWLEQTKNWIQQAVCIFKNMEMRLELVFTDGMFLFESFLRKLSLLLNSRIQM